MRLAPIDWQPSGAHECIMQLVLDNEADRRADAESMRAAIIQHLAGLLGGGGLNAERAKWFDDGIATCIAEIEDLPIPG